MDPFEPEQGGDAIEQGIEFERLGQEIVFRVLFAMAALEIMDVAETHRVIRMFAMLLPDGPRGFPPSTAGQGTSTHTQDRQRRAENGQTCPPICAQTKKRKT